MSELAVDDPATPDVSALIEPHLALTSSLSPPEDELGLDSLRDPAVLTIDLRASTS